MRHSLLITIGFAVLLAGSSALAQSKAPAPPPFYVEAADCTAAFQARVVTRLAQPKTDTRDKAILRDTEMGFIFIGVAYKEGLRKPEADSLLAAAAKRWAQLSKAEQEGRLATCATRSQQLMDDVTAFERFLVKNRANARVERLLEKERSQ
jgi:hypothetical protein